MVAGAGHVVNDFGFPFGPRYHATSSQLLNMSQYINKPFLLEKFVLLISASFSGNLDGYRTPTGSYDFTSPQSPFPVLPELNEPLPFAMNTFFIMNQRKGGNFSRRTGILNANASHDVPSTLRLSKGGPDIFVDTTRDVVTYANIVSIANNLSESYPALTPGLPGIFTKPHGTPHLTGKILPDVLRELNLFISHSNREGAFWSSRKIALSGAMLAPNGLQKPGNAFFRVDETSAFFGPGDSNPSRLGNGSHGINVQDERSWGGRNGLGFEHVVGRDFRVPVKNTNWLFTDFYPDRLSYVQNFNNSNPYLLFPTDKLVVGWQIPFNCCQCDDATGLGNITTTFYPGEAKLILYGSEIEEGKESHNTLNQLLTSNAVHEVIE
jgi:hypothetical protein